MNDVQSHGFLKNREQTRIFTGKKNICPFFKNKFDRIEDLYDVLCFAVHEKASDIIIQTGRPIFAKINGDITAITEYEITNNDTTKLFKWMTSDNAIMNRLEGGQDSDTAFEVPDYQNRDQYGEPIKHRFRLNLTAGHFIDSANGYQAVIRVIPTTPPCLEEIGFPMELMDYATPPQGIVLIAGSTGSGKTTTFAAIIRYILEGKTTINGNLLTFESPIEYSYSQICSPCATIQQHEIGRHINSFASGVRNSMRRNPSLIVIGELRDQETMEAALEAANTGHLVYSTVHANSVALILKRMINRFPLAQQPQAFSDFTDTCRLLMTQTLVKNAEGNGRICLREWLVITNEIRDALLNEGSQHHSKEIYSILEKEKTPLHRSMKQSVISALKNKLITTETARDVLRKHTLMTRQEEDEFLKKFI